MGDTSWALAQGSTIASGCRATPRGNRARSWALAQERTIARGAAPGRRLGADMPGVVLSHNSRWPPAVLRADEAAETPHVVRTRNLWLAGRRQRPRDDGAGLSWGRAASMAGGR